MTSLSLAPQQVALRVLFPDRYILQGFFRPSETGESAGSGDPVPCWVVVHHRLQLPPLGL